MTPEPAPALPPQHPYVGVPAAEPDPMSEPVRLASVFFSPGSAFRDIARRPRWWVPLILLSFASAAVFFVVGRQIGFETVARQTMDTNVFVAQMPIAQREQMIATQARILQYSSYGGVLLTAINYLLVAAVLKFLFDVILGADIGFRRLLAITTYGYLPQVLASLLTIAVVFLKPPEEFNLQDPLAFNLGAYLPRDAPGWLRGFGASMDLFSFWIIALLGIGVSAASRRVSTAKAILAILFPWGLWVCLRTALGILTG